MESEYAMRKKDIQMSGKNRLIILDNVKIQCKTPALETCIVRQEKLKNKTVYLKHNERGGSGE